ncbi:hypothetical protein TVAG_066770 [Trichomonas vaginalis G3]|uniref:Initiator binding domain-containing protein n=1 Tax=Trichomonas vaginalis (strain ATCC PRA-98 / G3) TaxID=412133 RepID=A2DS93_TRIV3|nr:transcription-initiator DNA-binding domain ibd family [Trichomonas vaginalis G3]EAY16672.1 hypothetical protein TVAG_066770 [Trichomonas vaginalis G3]KAI5543094.1 transcription-initiator DNA-binding domain ibd family [Trichomonas vaginalis G3]|eukprot:XP_001328895.1 hypothetical protein [Trichomonas vaginalis G3]
MQVKSIRRYTSRRSGEHLTESEKKDDLQGYLKLQKETKSLFIKGRCQNQKELFITFLEKVFDYCFVKGSLIPRRCLKCGIIWLPCNYYAICPTTILELYTKGRNNLNKVIQGLDLDLFMQRGTKFVQLAEFFNYSYQEVYCKFSIRICNNNELLEKFHNRAFPIFEAPPEDIIKEFQTFDTSFCDMPDEYKL